MSTIEDFIFQYEGAQQEIMSYLHEALVNHWNLNAHMRYKVPFYDKYSWICYLNPNKTGGIELEFVRGNELSNAQGLLESKGRKQVMGLSLHRLEEIPQQALEELIQEAILLDESVPYASKRKKKNS